ncbi:MAG: hypothetical protein ABTD50_24740, partial [Polyangiaceae bacterium]
AFLDMSAHDDNGCLLDFNCFTPEIRRKIDRGYTFCDDCLPVVEMHPLGGAMSAICGVLKTWSPVHSGGASINISGTVGAIAIGERATAIGRIYTSTDSLDGGRKGE